MKNFLIAFIVFLLWSIFGLWIYSLIQPSEIAVNSDSTYVEKKPIIKDAKEIAPLKDTIIETVNVQDTLLKKEPVNYNTLKAINENGEIIFLFSEGVSITKNSPELLIPNSIIDFKYKLNTYLIDHPESELHIISLYSPLEDVESPNLGMLRGLIIKDILIETGVSAEKIVIKPIIKDIQFNDSLQFNNSLTFSFKPLNLKRIENLKLEIPEAKTVYPKFSESGILANDNLQNLLLEVNSVMKNHPNIKIEIVGHTDNIGNSNDNYATGLKHARQVRWYLVSKGNIDKTKLIASSKGESEPIDSNNSHLGRIANRRIEVIFN